MSIDAMPIVRLEVANMRHVIQASLSEYVARLDSDIQAAVEAACRPENITRVIQEQTEHVIERVIREEVDRFFRYGDGRETIARAVREKLMNQTVTG